ncbi:transcription termination factor MTERF9, chloroplastic-like [Impatiens glandulifera]|uniref:transcription termination factor MTERF9, chloroplastic-like n=1 Tax=Impatiens glandulifera TaxID=253017 RepID=UPI001FB119DC|nr:transcription termination factor MTERF9, chloroplastic-like [Impatiens glandulifera]XP_047318291.1 transcription termination factor MTERF9, chloroplastic-like [Impatiens glandulifera]
MALISLHTLITSYSPSSTSFHLLLSHFHGEYLSRKRAKVKRLFIVSAAHSNAKILKTNRGRSRYDVNLSSYDSDESGDEEDDSRDDWINEDQFVPMKEFSSSKQRYNLGNMTKGNRAETTWNANLSKHASFEIDVSTSVVEGNNGRNSSGMRNNGAVNRENLKKMTSYSTKTKYPRLSEELDLDEKWIPLLDYLTTFGLKESHFIQMYERHMSSLQMNVTSAQERLEYLLSVGVKHKDIRKILLRQPQILEYTVEKNLKLHVAFLESLGIPNTRIGQIITATPSLFSYSVDNSLRPTVKYLLEEVGIKKSDLGKVVHLSPQILVQRIDSSWTKRLSFLAKELGASRDSVVKMVRKHPQLLHYSIEDGLLPRINFLRSIGMRNSEILKVLTSLSQVFSLSLENNLKPKYMYLVNELGNEVQSLAKYPVYLSLSLDQRIRPRHRFLIALKKAPRGPFPLSSFVPSDESFCEQWACTSVDKYLAFRQRLLVREFAHKNER